MKEQLISFEIKGFKGWLKKQTGYTIGRSVWEHSLPYICKLALLQKWLREEKGKSVLVFRHVDKWNKILHGCTINQNTYDNLVSTLQSYEEALEEGLKEALKLLS